MTTTVQNRHPKGEPTGGQFAATAHTEPGLRLTTEATQESLYATATSGTDADRAKAARTAMDTCAFTFEELTRDGDQESVEHLAQDDEKVLRAIDNLGSLEADEQPYFGKFIAEQLHQDAQDAEEAYWAGRYANERALDIGPIPEDAYEVTDPKHPYYADRLGL